MTTKPYDGSQPLNLGLIYSTRPQAERWRSDIENLVTRVRWLEAKLGASSDAAPLTPNRAPVYRDLPEATRLRVTGLVDELGDARATDVGYAVLLLVLERLESRGVFSPAAAVRRALGDAYLAINRGNDGGGIRPRGRPEHDTED